VLKEVDPDLQRDYDLRLGRISSGMHAVANTHTVQNPPTLAGS
jgi:hypothetical protein